MTAAVDQLRDALGEPVRRVNEHNWSELAQRLRDYVLNPDRLPVDDYYVVREELDRRWSLPVVETDYTIGSMGPLAEGDPAYGRCGVRLLNLLGHTDVHLVIRRPAGGSAEGRLLWALLHELGHFVNHFELLLSLSTLYQRVCLSPSLEMTVGQFARQAGASLNEQHELEADLFAADWLLPPWIDSDASVGRAPGVPAGLTPDGYRFYRLRCALGGALTMPSHPEGIEMLCRAGAEERSRCTGPYPHDSQPWDRASWVLFNRAEVRSRVETPSKLDADYYKTVGSPSRHVPELTRKPAQGPPFDSSLAWLRRVSAAEAMDEVEAVLWSPFLVPSPAAGHPDFHIPVRPAPSRRSRDSELGWMHMIAPTIRRPRSLQQWIADAHAQGAGVLLFPRSPAERVLDGEGAARG